MIDKDLELALKQCEKEFGKGSVIYSDEIMEIDRISTGSYILDSKIGGGIPVGRIVEIYAPEAVGKTTLCIHHMVEHQKLGGVVAIVDTEHSFNMQYAEKLGLRRFNDAGDSILIISQPSFAEEALQITETLIKSGKISLCVVDSVAALVPRAEVEGDMGEQKMGLQARLMSQAMRKLTSIVQKTNTILVFTNQLRLKIGVVYGNPEITSGGNALKYYASLRLDMRKGLAIKDSLGEIIGNNIKIKVAKNKTYPPFKVAETRIIFDRGIDVQGEVIDLAVEQDIINKSGSWYSYGDMKIGQGLSQVVNLMQDNEELFEEIKQKLNEK